MAESVGKWDASSVGRYYDAFHKHGTNWPAVSEAASRGVDTCEALYRQHQTFLGLPHSPALGAAFVAMVKDHYNNIKDEGGDEADGAVQDGAGAGVAAAAGSGDMDTRGGGGTAGVDATTEDAMDAEADDEGTSNLVLHDADLALHALGLVWVNQAVAVDDLDRNLSSDTRIPARIDRQRRPRPRRKRACCFARPLLYTSLTHVKQRSRGRLRG
ncbi:hypothetical protein FOA52_005232 [Chlamydomonas sp. UWO 241]|nr:hypothetical protein FOA52_005232 [Chlamydomonas sp. UWO 241]